MTVTRVTLPLLALATLCINYATAFWRMPCGIVQMGRIDPVVFPGTISAHVHKISGGSNIDINSTHDSMLQSQCTSCAVQADRSGYWTPQLYYQHSNGSFEEVPNDEMLIYYLARGPDSVINKTIPFPHGFRMLSGNPYLRVFDNQTLTWDNSTPIAERVSYNCIDNAVGGSIWQDFYVRDYNCTGGLRAQIGFPACWNGADLYQPDQSHVAYLSGVATGSCPDTHPYYLPFLFFEVFYAVANIDTSLGGQYVFAMGDPTGFGFHGDFINGWDMDVLKAGVDTCLWPDNGGLLANCSVFQPYNRLSDYDLDCPMQLPRIDEDVSGMIGTSLPGCNPVIPGPPEGPAQASVATCVNETTPALINNGPQTPSSIPFPVAGQSVGEDGWDYVGCYSDLVGGLRTLAPGYLKSPDSMSVSLCQEYCTEQGYPYAGVEYQIECYCGSEIAPGTPTIAAGQGCLAICPGNNSQICGDAVEIGIYENTQYSGFPPGAGPTPVAAGIYQGCGTDGVDGRSLDGVVNGFVDANLMTNELCRQLCDQAGFWLSGTEYSSQCYCGNELVNGGTMLSDNSTCNMVCSGSRNETCGGSDRVSIFASLNNTLAPVGDALSSSSASPNSGSSSSQTTFASSTTSTSTTSSATYPAAATPLSCPDADQHSYSTSGAMYLIECGNDRDGVTIGQPQAASFEACLGTCATTTGCLDVLYVPPTGLGPGPCYLKSNVGTSRLGNSAVWGAQYLGVAPMQSSTSISTTSSTSTGGSTSSKSTSGSTSSTSTSGSTSSKSISGSMSSTSSSSTSSSTTSPETGSKSSTSSQSNVLASIITSTATSTSKSQSQTSSRTSSTASATPSNAAGFVGCASDPNTSGGVALSSDLTTDSAMTAESCMSYCYLRGYGLAGLRQGNMCTCGNYLSEQSGARMLSETEMCSLPCAGNAGQACGGNGFLSVYWSAGAEPDVNFRRKLFL